MINFSFIIPHKNTPDLLQKCLDSIPRRDDVQIIVVDDNSDSDKVDFSHFPGSNDSTVEVYLTKDGKGAGYARNVGLMHAIGKWLIFADADDYFNPCIVYALEQYIDDESDIVFFKGTCINLATKEPGHRGELMNQAIEKAICTNDYSSLLLLTAPWRRFIKRSLVQNNGIQFHEVRWANDVVFIAKVAVQAHSIKASTIPIYCITESPASLVYCRSLESQIVRFLEEGKAARIYRQRFSAGRMSYWYFYTWISVYKLNKWKAIQLIPTAIYNNGISFIIEALKAKFS